MFDLTEKVALVTGASSGIGRGIAIALSRQRAKVALAARRIDRLTQLSEELKKEGKDVLVVKMDVTNTKEVESGVSQVIGAFGRLDILVNNAGVYEGTDVFDFKEDSWDKVVATNLKAYMVLSHFASIDMAKRSWGRIVNIGSVAMGNQGFGIPGGSAYAASKGGVVGLTESLAAELASKNILVNCIAPGLIESEMTQGIVSDKKQLEMYLSRIPLKRAGKPEEIAAGVIYLVSGEASYVTGATFVIDGGWLAA
ncbi:3-oxoacyl-ACP reductase FabG [Candidatus Gottesmanbacteria bacterium]|nr:3-oxoacyl-ACP reductase FabG [Candidatus Gottesmanbacteria bacterium]